MSYQVIARKWRPQRFADVVGSSTVTRTLSNAIQSGRVAHAYIFFPARAAWKDNDRAASLRRRFNLREGPARNLAIECDSCSRSVWGISSTWIEIGRGVESRIDQIRECAKWSATAPAGGR